MERVSSTQVEEITGEIKTPASVERTQECATDTVVDLEASPVEEVTSEGFVVDVLEGEDVTSKLQQDVASNDGPKLNEDRFFGRPLTDEEELARQNSTASKVETVLSWCFIASLLSIVVGVLIWHYSVRI